MKETAEKGGYEMTDGDNTGAGSGAPFPSISLRDQMVNI